MRRTPLGSWRARSAFASARAGGKFRQKISLRKESGKLAPSVPVWKNVSAKRVAGELADFVRDCLARV